MALQIKNISKQFSNKIAVRDLTIDLSPGIYGLLGPNGAGKSTFFKMLSTIERPSKGEIFWKGKNIVKNPDTLRKELGYLPQDFGVYPNMNALEFLDYMAALKRLPKNLARKRIDELLEALHLSPYRKRLLGTYSGGMKQRVGIAQALLNDPELLIVDEPTVGLDPEERMRFQNLLSTLSSKSVIILSTHIVSDVEAIASNILIMNHGELLIQANPQKLITAVNGKTWEVILSSPEEILQLKEKFLISRIFHQQNGIHVRIICDTSPHQKAQPKSASLEDAYLYKIHSKGV
ncbi:ABC-2 type transport system ATP-binding protein [Bacillus sp. SORGH_AS 510]|uniref:ABC transporter ATP-binding protein n=1 Tax=Bacillus sp. SORGH_AS_0510 TaxID=3041771 RepID=UPI00278A13ED|nr:ABC transporter ATP-binding protein [Bacillus sp. SORGH_AS_0510]MDQ1143868.1 ABC-2 type transport system ATP-binding protein [Bacillus sp. SORGH_AS_0510]